MGHQCYYIGTSKEQAEDLRTRLLFGMKEAMFCGMKGTIEFKKDVPCSYNPSTKEYTSVISGDENMIYYVVEGDRGELGLVLNHSLQHMLHDVMVLRLDDIQHDLFLPEFKRNKGRKAFENEYVKICS